MGCPLVRWKFHRTMTHLVPTIAVILSLYGCAGVFRVSGKDLASKPLQYIKLTRMLEKEAKISSVRVNGCQRDSRGSKLFITFSFRQKDDEVFRTAVVTSNGIDFVQGFSRVLYDDSANAIIRLEGTKGQY